MLQTLKNKIAFVGPLPPPLGGVAVINHNFQKMNFENYEIIKFDTSSKKERENLNSKINLKKIIFGLKIFKEFYRFLKSEKPELINIFVTSGYSILREIILLIIIKRFKIPVIIHFHSKTKGEFALKKNHLKFLGFLFNKMSKKIIVLSEYHLLFFKNYFNENKLVVVENFVLYSDYSNNIEDKIDDFLFVGRLTIEKGFFDLIQAILILKNENIFFKINVIGMAETFENEKKISEIISQNNLSNYFNFYGSVYDENKNNIFKKTKCLIFPSQFENSPVVLKEAIAAKMAIIASDINANKLILNKHNNNVLFECKNSIDLANKIKQLIYDQEKLQELCVNSSKILDYDILFAQLKMEELFNEILKK
jgi:glycosyltransferase involved in cell wall biosynthesis